MPRTEEANQQIRERRRDQILTVATAVFARKGLTDTSIADIAAVAEISHGLVYRHFASKEEIFVAVIGRALEQAQQLTEDVRAQSGTPWERLHWLIERILPGQALGLRPHYFLVILYALTHENVPEQAYQLAVQQGALIHNVVRELIIEGQRTRQIRPFDPDQLAHLLLSCIQGLIVGKAFRQRNLDISPLPTADMVLSLFLFPLSEK